MKILKQTHALQPNQQMGAAAQQPMQQAVSATEDARQEPKEEQEDAGMTPEQNSSIIVPEQPKPAVNSVTKPAAASLVGRVGVCGIACTCQLVFVLQGSQSLTLDLHLIVVCKENPDQEYAKWKRMMARSAADGSNPLQRV